jgi:hypothetical protein
MSFLEELCNLMSSREFKYFREKYMKQWSDVETMFMYIYIHEYISVEYKRRFLKEITKEEMMNILRRIFLTPELRRQAVVMFRSYQAHADDVLHLTRPIEENKVSSLPMTSDINKTLSNNTKTTTSTSPILRLPSYVFLTEERNVTLTK